MAPLHFHVAALAFRVRLTLRIFRVKIYKINYAMLNMLLCHDPFSGQWRRSSHVIGPALWGHEHLKFIVLVLVGGFEGIPCGAYAAVRGGLAL